MPENNSKPPETPDSSNGTVVRRSIVSQVDKPTSKPPIIPDSGDGTNRIIKIDKFNENA